jgi:hypothetical protein
MSKLSWATFYGRVLGSLALMTLLRNGLAGNAGGPVGCSLACLFDLTLLNQGFFSVWHRFSGVLEYTGKGGGGGSRGRLLWSNLGWWNCLSLAASLILLYIKWGVALSDTTDFLQIYWSMTTLWIARNRNCPTYYIIFWWPWKGRSKGWRWVKSRQKALAVAGEDE